MLITISGRLRMGCGPSGPGWESASGEGKRMTDPQGNLLAACKVLKFRSLAMIEPSSNLKRNEPTSVSLALEEKLVFETFARRFGESISEVMRSLMYRGLESLLRDGKLEPSRDWRDIYADVAKIINDDPQLRDARDFLVAKQEKEKKSARAVMSEGDRKKTG